MRWEAESRVAYDERGEGEREVAGRVRVRLTSLLPNFF